MGVFKNISYSGYIKRYGIVNGIKRGIFTAMPIHYISDYENKKILYYKKVKKWIKKHYIYAENIEPEGLKSTNVEIKNAVWVYWKQGVENAPIIVQKCIESIKKYAGDSCIVLDENNLSDYLQFPEYVYEKHKNGNISDAAFSDLIRLSLLDFYGGTWIDATVFLTGEIPKYILESKLFMFQDSFGLIENPARFPNWFIHSEKNNQVIKKVKNISFEYWKHEKYVKEYLFEYIIMNIILEKENDLLDEMPYVSSEYTGLLLKKLDKKNTDFIWKHIQELTNIHKLTYKLNKEFLDDKENIYNYIIGEKENV